MNPRQLDVFDPHEAGYNVCSEFGVEIHGETKGDTLARNENNFKVCQWDKVVSYYVCHNK